MSLRLVSPPVADRPIVDEDEGYYCSPAEDAAFIVLATLITGAAAALGWHSEEIVEYLFAVWGAAK